MRLFAFARRALALSCSLPLVACAAPPPEPKAATDTAPATPASAPPEAAPAEPPMVELPTGALAPVEHPELHEGTILAAEQTGDLQTIEVRLPDTLRPDRLRPGTVRLGQAGPEPRSFVLWLHQRRPIVPGQPAFHTLWLRRRVDPTQAADASPIIADLYFDANVSRYDGTAGHHYRVRVPAPGRLTPNPKLVNRYLFALGSAAPQDTPLAWWLAPPNTLQGDTRAAWSARGDWGQLMRLTTGYESIEGALVWDKQLRAAPAKATIPIGKLQPPDVPRHPWAEMLAALPGGAAPIEPLAQATPADFYFLRARAFAPLQTLLDELDRFLTPAMRALDDGRGMVRHLADRYRTELALESDGLSRLFGPALVDSLVLMGSDPFLRQGSDVSVVFATKDLPGLERALAVKRAIVARGRALTLASFEHAGVRVATHLSKDGAVRQHMASFTPPGSPVAWLLVSNSRKATERILETWSGKRPNLADELDFRYMLSRDAGVPDDLLVYFGDRFVLETVGPSQRILDARRQLAKAELVGLGQSALVYGWVHGRAPKDRAELARAPWMNAQRFQHASGGRIDFEIGQAPRSVWGTPRALTPLIDLPAPTRVSETEKKAYEEFSNGYRWAWSERVDPIAIRVRPVSSPAGTELDVHVRVLPVMTSRDYGEIAALSGGTGVSAPTLTHGLSGTLALGPTSPLRSMLSGQSRLFLGDRFKFDWLGDWVQIGIADRTELPRALVSSEFVPHLPGSKEKSEEEMLVDLPAYLALDLKSATGAALVLATLRKMLEDSAPDVADWGETKKFRGQSIVRVKLDEVAVYYALTKKRLFASFNRAVVEQLIAGEDTGGAGGPSRSPSGGGQLVVDLNPKNRESALMLALVWLVEGGMRRDDERQRALPDLLFHGAPELAKDTARLSELSLAYLGATPVTPDGVSYEWSPLGTRDPARGTPHAPLWPKIPVPGGQLDRVLAALLGVTSEVAIEVEPSAAGGNAQRSLKSAFRVKLAPPSR